MAGAITDNRTQITSADNTTNWVASASASQDTEIFIEGSASVADNMTNSLRYLMYNNTTTFGWGTNQIVWIWVNCGIVGLLQSKASGGMRIRFAGATVTDYFEVYVGGNDSWPTSIEGGWTLFAVNVTDARSAATTNGWTNGTTPAVANVQHVGIAAICSSMPRNADNTWVDSIWTAPASQTHFRVKGDNGGTADWTFADINTQLGNSAGLFLSGPAGSWVINGKLGFETDGTYGTTDFTDTNQLILFGDHEYIGDGDFGIRFASTTASDILNVTLGIKTGTGDDATGAQGVTFQAPATGDGAYRPEFTLVGTNSITSTFNLDFYGVTWNHFFNVNLSDWAFPTGSHTINIDMVTTSFIDCSILYLGTDSTSTYTATAVRNAVINANTADNVAFAWIDDLSRFRFSSFEFSDGHAVEIREGTYGYDQIPASQTSKGNTFTGYGANDSTDAAILNTGEKPITINVTEQGDTPTYRNESAETNIVFAEQANNYAAGAGTTLSASFSGPRTVDTNISAVTIYNGNNGACTSVNDGSGDNLVLQGTNYDATTGTTMDLWVLEKNANGPTTITATYPASVTNRGIQIQNWTRATISEGGVKATDFDFAAQTNPGTATDAVTTANVTTDSLNDDGEVFGLAWGNETTVLSAGTGYSAAPGGLWSNQAYAENDQIVTSGVGQAATWTAGSSTVDTHALAVAYDPIDSETTVQNTVTITVQVDDADGAAVEGARVRVELDPAGTLVAEGTTNASGTFTDSTYNYVSNQDVLTKVRLKGFRNFRTGGEITANGLTVGVRFEEDKIVDLP